MNPELQIMFHILLFAVCVVISLLWEIGFELVIRSKEPKDQTFPRQEKLKTPIFFMNKVSTEPDVLSLFLNTLWFFVPLEIVFWILYWICV